MKNILHLNFFCCFFRPKNPKLYIADTGYSLHFFYEPQVSAIDRFDCKSNHTMKLGQLTEYNTRNTFLEQLYTKCARETILRLTSKKSKFEQISRSVV